MILLTKKKYRITKKGKKRISKLHCNLLAKELGIGLEEEAIGPGPFINWGRSTISIPSTASILNHPNAVANSVNKLTAFMLFNENEVPCPQWTTEKEEAAAFFNDGKKRAVFCRTLINSSCGKGIVIARSPEELVDAPLYTKQILKDREYRVHIFKDECILIQQKRKVLNQGSSSFDPLIRNHSNGYIFSVNNVQFTSESEKENLIHISKKAINALGLDFGAVDLAISPNGNIFVFEVNTSPGLDGETTFNAYKQAILQLI